MLSRLGLWICPDPVKDKNAGDTHIDEWKRSDHSDEPVVERTMDDYFHLELILAISILLYCCVPEIEGKDPSTQTIVDDY